MSRPPPNRRPASAWTPSALAAVAALLAVSAPPAPAADADAPALPAISRSHWVWSHTNAISGQQPFPTHVWFRRTFDLSELPVSAAILITADDGYELFVNGQPVGQDLGTDDQHRRSIEKYDLSNLLLKGRNAIAVHGTCLRGSAGLVAAMRADFSLDLPLEFVTDARWKASPRVSADWQQTEMDDSSWPPAVALAQMGGAPWGTIRYGDATRPSAAAQGSAPRAATPASLLQEPPPGFRAPEAIVFVADDCSLGSNGRTIFRVGNGKAWTQNDVPGPSLVGRRLLALRPAGAPDARPVVLFDSRGGIVGSPSASYDGRWVYFSHLPPGGAFFQVFRVPTAGGAPERLTHGPFHDFDPVELPDGRIAFSSTRVGTFEEYHSAPARGLFALDLASRAIRPLAASVVFDNDPQVTADGRIAFVRADNFGERAKVETHIHVVRPDGTGGVTEFSANRPPLRYDRARAGGDLPALLRSYGYGSPAPLPDGRLACLSHAGLLLALPGETAPIRVGNLSANQVCDVSPLPDNRLLCTLAAKDAIGVLDPRDGKIAALYRSPDTTVHSAAYLGPRPRPPRLPRASRDAAEEPYPTGTLVCQSVFNTRHTALDWSRARAVRFYEGKGLTQRSSHSDIVHIGTEAIEWGTAPLAPDGSFHVEVPADRAMALQIVDAEGREIVSSLSWIYVRPGERRSCVGCHAPRQISPANAATQPLALAWPPARLLGQGRPHRFRANNADNGGALNLQMERFREVASIDLYELDVAPGPGRDAEVRRAIADLQTGSADARISAARRLAIHRDRAAAPALAALLANADRETRLNAALALGACGNRAAVPPLIEALGDDDPLVAQAAWASLAHLTGQSLPFDPRAPAGSRGEAAWKAWAESPWAKTEDRLIAALDPAEPLARRAAVLALAHVGGPAAAAALRQRLAADQFNDDLRTTLEAIRALGHLNDAPSLPLLARLLNVHGEDSVVAAAPEPPPAAAQPAVRTTAARADNDLSDLTENAPPAGLAEDLRRELAARHAKTAAQTPPSVGPSPRRKQRPDVTFYHRAAAAAEALGRIGAAVPEAKPAAEAALIRAHEALDPFSTYCGAYGDHSALHACHASPMHHRIAEALDAMAATHTAPLIARLLLSLPTDPDRGLLLECDAVERIVGRVVARSGRADAVIEACLAALGDPGAKAAPDLAEAVVNSPNAWAGNPRGEARAAQVLSAVCVDARHGPRVLAAFDRYRRLPPTPLTPQLGNPGYLPPGHWVPFFLARALGRMRYAGAVESLLDGVANHAPESALGRPAAPAVHLLYLHNTQTPLWRAAAADALGRIGDRRAAPVLLAAVANLENATDVRAAAARALGRLADPASLDPLRRLTADYPETSTRQELLAAIARTEAGGAPAPAVALAASKANGQGDRR